MSISSLLNQMEPEGRARMDQARLLDLERDLKDETILFICRSSFPFGSLAVTPERLIVLLDQGGADVTLFAEVSSFDMIEGRKKRLGGYSHTMLNTQLRNGGRVSGQILGGGPWAIRCGQTIIAAHERYVIHGRTAVPSPPSIEGRTPSSREGLDTAPIPGRDRSEHHTTEPSWFQKPVYLIAAAAIISVIAVAAFLALRSSPSSTPAAPDQPATCVAQATDAKPLAPSGGGGGSATYAPSCGAITLQPANLPELASNQTYVIWAIANDQIRSQLGTIPKAASATQDVTVQTEASDSMVGITTEVDGTKGPTLPFIWNVILPSSG